MNENLNLVEILKDCPKGTKLYSTVYGEVEFIGISNEKFSIKYAKSDGSLGSSTAQGLLLSCYDGECTLFPSKDQRDWSKFKHQFDPKTLKPFDKVLVRNSGSSYWRCAFYSNQRKEDGNTSDRYVTTASSYICCIPYNEETKYLIGTTEEPPEYYKYWKEIWYLKRFI